MTLSYQGPQRFKETRTEGGGEGSGANEYLDRTRTSKEGSDELLMRLRASIAAHARRAQMNPTRAQLYLVNGVKPKRGM